MEQQLTISPEEFALLTQIERDACKESFFEFVVSFWDVVIQEEPVFNWHIPFLCEELQKLSVSIVARQAKPYDLTINIPPGTTKSTIATIMWPAWLWTQDPSLRIISNSYSMDLSIEHAVKSRDIILSDKYRRLFPEVKVRKDKGAKSMYETTKTGARYTTSTGGTITGKHAHVIINDDPLNPSQAASDAERKTANEHTKTLSSRKVNKANTPTVTIMQRLHESDVTGYTLAKKGNTIRHICLPAEASGDVKPPELRERYVNGLLDPVRLNRDVLNEAKVDLGTQGYAGQFLQSPFVAGGTVVKKDWYRFVSRETFNRMRKNEPIVFFGDGASTDDEDSNDPSGFIGTCKIGEDLYITHAEKVWMELPELIKWLPSWVKARGYTESSTIRIEPKASGHQIVQMLKRMSGLNILFTETPKESKMLRFTAASPKVESGRVILVVDLWNDEFIDETTGFPNKVHDEYVDLLAYAVDYHLAQTTNNLNRIANQLH